MQEEIGLRVNDTSLEKYKGVFFPSKMRGKRKIIVDVKELPLWDKGN